jgi:hypothetical protein
MINEMNTPQTAVEIDHNGRRRRVEVGDAEPTDDCERNEYKVAPKPDLLRAEPFYVLHVMPPG